MNKSKAPFVSLVFASLFLVISAPVTMAACGASPVAADDVAKVSDESIDIDVLANDTSHGLALTLTVSSKTCNGTTATDFDLLTFTPASPVQEPCEIVYEITDEDGDADTATVTIQIIEGIFSDAFESGDTSRWSAS